MKKLLMIGIAVLALGAVAQEKSVSLADARAQISEVAENSNKLADLMGKMSADDQKTFLSDVNAAIAKLHGTTEEKAARFLNANKAALEAGKKVGNVQNLLAETFATVPLEALTVLNEELAKDNFNRASDPSKTYTDEEYLGIVSNNMSNICNRTVGDENEKVRDGFAALMFIRAANNPSETLREGIINTLPEDVRETARTEWYPAALGENQDKTYDPMLGIYEAADPVLTLGYAGPQKMVSLLSSLAAKDPAADLRMARDFEDVPDEGLNRVPRTTDKNKRYYPGYPRQYPFGDM